MTTHATVIVGENLGNGIAGSLKLSTGGLTRSLPPKTQKRVMTQFPYGLHNWLLRASQQGSLPSTVGTLVCPAQ